MTNPRWGIVATIKAPVRDIMNFVAHHLELGADHIFIYLDHDNQAAQTALADHPKVTVTRTDQNYWQSVTGKRPERHQVRQTRNATHCYQQAHDLDWLCHIDVDEFLWPTLNILEELKNLEDDMFCARIRPAEVLAQDGLSELNKRVIYCKAWIPPGQKRREIPTDIYPTYGRYLRGGFLSHVQGKLFVRTGVNDVTLKIHNVFHGEKENPNTAELQSVTLIHFHAAKMRKWMRSFPYRHVFGSYRAELRSVPAGDQDALSLHQMFCMIHEDKGEQGLQDFFEEVNLATSQLRTKLSEHGLLREYKLKLDKSLRTHFPDFKE